MYSMIVMLAGGVGASKLILGFSRLLSPDQLTVIGNTGDDGQLIGGNQEPSICKVFCLRDPRWWGPLKPCLRIHCVKWIRL